MESGAGGHVILVVDDVSVDRKLAARCLEREGHKYCLAYDGMQALQMLRSQAIDLVRGGACDTASRGELLPVERGACFFFFSPGVTHTVSFPVPLAGCTVASPRARRACTGALPV